MSAKSAAKPGTYNPDITPWVAGMHAALDDPNVHQVVALKSAQIAWTDGVLLNYIGRRIDMDPIPMIVMFAKEADAKAFEREKLVPMVEVTPRLADKVPVGRTRNATWDYKPFPGGFIKLVGSNSPGSVKSTPAPFVAVEEPDDSNANVKGQGDTIALVRERTKTFARRKLVFGGTPTVEGVSKIEEAYKGSDKRQFWVPCPHCEERQVLVWTQVKWNEDPTQPAHEVYGHAVLDSARYCCVHCGALWTNGEKIRAVRQAEWRASAPFHGIAGFSINELYSPFPGSQLRHLVAKYLEAEHALRQGDDTKKRAFVNNTEGRAYAYKTSVPDKDALRERCEAYPMLTVPWGGVVLTAGVDVQHDRLAVVIRAWGRDEESWLVWWGELYGRTLVVKWNDDGSIDRERSGAWGDLDQLLTSTFPHANGAPLRIRAGSIDSSDGQTQDAVYSYVRRRTGMGLLAIKGDSHDPKREIFVPPKMAVDTNGKHRPHPTGVRPYLVGTQVAKDLILGSDDKAGRIKLLGHGPGRMHWYRDELRADYFDQLTSEVKVPHKTIRGRLVWMKQSGRRNEALDCEVYALHAARSLKLNLWRGERWQQEEAALQQPALFGDVVKPVVLPPAASGVQTSAQTAQEAPQAHAAALASPEPEEAPVARPSTPAAPAAKSSQPINPLRRGGWSAKRW
tara:strand:- start:5750 stop:7786 length:2037 start_codon:yes stop_codon:yes gene_type:complete